LYLKITNNIVSNIKQAFYYWYLHIKCINKQLNELKIIQWLFNFFKTVASRLADSVKKITDGKTFYPINVFR